MFQWRKYPFYPMSKHDIVDLFDHVRESYLAYSSMPCRGAAIASTVASASPATPNKTARATAGIKLLTLLLGDTSKAFGTDGETKVVDIPASAKG